MKAGMKIFGTRGVYEDSNDLKHLHIRNKFKTLYSWTLSKEEYNELLESHLFLKDKIYKTIKVIMVYGGNKQHDTIDK